MQNVILLKIYIVIHFHGDYCKFVQRCRGLYAEWLKLKQNFIVGIYSCLNQVISRSHQLTALYP